MVVIGKSEVLGKKYTKTYTYTYIHEYYIGSIWPWRIGFWVGFPKSETLRGEDQGKLIYWTWNQDTGSGTRWAPVITLGINPGGKQSRNTVIQINTQGQSRSAKTNLDCICLFNLLAWCAFITSSTDSNDWFQWLLVVESVVRSLMACVWRQGKEEKVIITVLDLYL